MDTLKTMRKIKKDFIDKEYPRTDTRRGFVIMYTIQLLEFINEQKLWETKEKESNPK